MSSQGGTSPELMVCARGLAKTYSMPGGDVRALGPIDLQIRTGEYVAILGASGSGKSTLLNLLGGLDTATGGELVVDHCELAGLNKTALAAFRNRTVGFVFQQFNLLPMLTAVENVALPLAYAGVPRRERLERAAATLVRLGLGERLEHRPSQLSGGQQQRVAIGRAIVTDPRLVLADEPTGALDVATSDEVLQILGELRDQGRTLIVVTHNPDVANAAERRISVRDGLIVADGRAKTSPPSVGKRV